MALFAGLIAVAFFIGSRAAPYIGPGALNAVRFLIGSVIVGSIAFVMTPPGSRAALFKPVAFWRFLVLGGCMSIYFIAMFMALKVTSSVSTGAVLTLMPLMSAGLAFLINGQRSSVVLLTSLVVAAAGAIWVIFRGDIHAILAFNIGKGEAIFFVGCLAHATHNVFVRRFNRGESTLYFTFWTAVAAFICLTVYSAPELLRTHWTALPPIVWGTILYLATATTAGAMFLLQYSMLRIPPAKANAYMLLTPSYVIIMEGFAGAGWASPAVMAGALVTVAGLVILILSPDV